MKRGIGILLCFMLATGAFALTGCTTADYYVGIAKIETHVALDAAENGFKTKLNALLAADGKTVAFDSQNANGESSNLATIATTLAASKNNLILAIATPTAQALKNACEDKPILFTAVTDAKEAELVASNAAPGGNVSGTSDMNPIKQQLELMCELVDGLSKIAVLYTTGEKNSLVQVDILESECAAKGITLIKKGVNSINDIDPAFTSLAGEAGLQAIYIPTDNVIAKAAAQVHNVNKESLKLPIVCGETGMNELCGVATYGIDYYKLGEQTGEMAYRILVSGADISMMPVEYQTGEPKLSVNTNIAGEIGFTIPQAVLNKVA